MFITETDIGQLRVRVCFNRQVRNGSSEESREIGGGTLSSTVEGRGIDPDLRLLLRNCQPLLQSRNSAVVMAVCQLYYHLAPSSELAITTKALIRLLRSHRETQTVVLSNIASLSSMSTSRKGMFEPHLKSFFVRTSDPTQIKLLKLEVSITLLRESIIDKRALNSFFLNI